MNIGFMAEMHLSQATDIFLFNCRFAGWGQQTRRRYRDVLASFIALTGDILVKDLTPDHVRLYIAELADRPDKGTKHLSRRYAVIRTWVRWLYAQKQITERGSFDKAPRRRKPSTLFSSEELAFISTSITSFKTCRPEYQGEWVMSTAISSIKLETNEMTPEHVAFEKRKAILKAVKCPGKTHTLIKSKALRAEFARELNDWRNQALSNGSRLSEWGRRTLKEYSGSLENGFWAMQKAENRTFLYERRRVFWQLTAEIDNRPTEEKERYSQYETAVVATHMKVLNILTEINADFEAGKIDEMQRARRRRLIMDKEEDKIKKLQMEFGV